MSVNNEDSELNLMEFLRNLNNELKELEVSHRRRINEYIDEIEINEYQRSINLIVNKAKKILEDNRKIKNDII